MAAHNMKLALQVIKTLEAEDFFEGSCNVDLGPVMTTSDMGIHSAAMGGIWQSAFFGFGSVRIVENALHIRPRLHSKWKELSFSIVWHVNPLSITIRPDQIRIKNRGEKPTGIVVNDEHILVAPAELTIRIVFT